ncbi:hypothetical protein Q9R08_04955 [Microbacterium sp. QXD-8]|uniref:Uncharacterized protein n=1 Tax=Microbacterium psychrotolerans TaxID=3068321 RepID=A0ABU0Z1B2_9MICO|nr:hypothetical protein [Microbacterium sp. QXD-8]MDQ7877321.1 hypothetical protein [Microbacterium sp. QXD-8]
MAHTPRDSRITLSRQTVQHLLWYEGDTNLGLDGGHFVNRLIHLIKAADEDNRDWIATQFPEYVHGVEIIIHAHWALDWMRGLAKRYDSDQPLLGDDFPLLMKYFEPHPPVPGIGRVPDGDVLVWSGGVPTSALAEAEARA